MHFKHSQSDLSYFDISEACGEIIKKPGISFYKKYSIIEGYNDKQRQSLRYQAMVCKKTPIDKKTVDLIHTIKKKISMSIPLEQFMSFDLILKIEGIDIKIFIPFYDDQNKRLILLKITQDAGEQFEREVIKKKYYCEAALMVDAINELNNGQPNIYILAIEINEPHAYAFYKISEELLTCGRQENHEKINLINQCEKQNNYPSYFDGNAKIIEKPHYL